MSPTAPCSTPSLPTRRGLLTLGLGLTAGAAGAALGQEEPPSGQPRVIYAVRHAEKGEGQDPVLTEAGAARARQLAEVLRDVPLSAVYSTSPQRTRLTAAPVAEGRGLEVTTYRPQKGALSGQLLAGTGPALVVGHSNTIPALLRELGADPGAGELQGYDDLFLLLLLPAQGGAPRALLQHLHYGARSAAAHGH